MPFRRYATGALSQRNMSPDSWGNFLEGNRNALANGSRRTASQTPNLIAQASEILQEQFDPANYMLSHVTIVASVDTEEVPNVRTGSLNENGRRILRKYSDYRITPETDSWTNNNGDSWARGTLLKSYRTFIGADNFLEHVQIPEQSKGRIIDAVARDIGPSVYIDILVATNRKHASLIRDIDDGRMGTLSMGCSCLETTCTKCGNVAADETDLCDHIRYEKRNYFYDDQGKRRIIAELCGHPSIDPTGGITFIEASWVAVPAFRGAVLRNVLEPEVISLETQRQVLAVLSSPPKEWIAEGTVKAAKMETPTRHPRTLISGEEDFTPSDDAPADDAAAPADAPAEEEADADPLSTLEDEVEKILLDRVKNRIKKKLEGDSPAPGELATSTGDNIIHQGSALAKIAEATDVLVRIARSDIELVDSIARLDQSFGLKNSRDVYRTALRVGSTDSQTSPETYLARCAEVLDRQLTTGEAKTLVRLGRILSLWKRT
jgi:hypothetical protein